MICGALTAKPMAIENTDQSHRGSSQPESSLPAGLPPERLWAAAMAHSAVSVADAQGVIRRSLKRKI